MKPLQNKIKEAVRLHKVNQTVVEKDYALSYVLAGISSVPVLSETLVFKGGTALKKLFFGNYRFSEDLDFTALKAPEGDELERNLNLALTETLKMLSEYGPFIAKLFRYHEKEPHPEGQEAFIIRLKYPWHPEPLCKIKIEITHKELLLLKPEKRNLIHDYEESLKVTLLSYSIEEIITEKMRTILQTHQNLLKRGWTRPRARDYYDLWHLLKEFNSTINKNIIPEILKKKCEYKKVYYTNIEDFFPPALISEVERNWEQNLRSFVSELPSCNLVLSELHEKLFPELFR
ncbi:MAG: nucleotidyl transferase AbiEii/AbiGii toxin family protein [Candidatus Eremiobacterota bacterium]